MTSNGYKGCFLEKDEGDGTKGVWYGPEVSDNGASSWIVNLPKVKVSGNDNCYYDFTAQCFLYIGHLGC